jgi:hypothetical protein
MSLGNQIDRRGFLATGAGFVLLGAVGCTAPVVKSQPPTPGPSTGASTPAGSPTPSTLTPTPRRSFAGVALPTVAPWQPSSSDVEPAAKQRAVRVIEAIGSWAVVKRGAAAAAASRVSALREASSLAHQVPLFLDSASSAVVEVIDAQYGGILVDSASVLVVCRQWRAGDKLTQAGTTIDVRLRRVRGQWWVTALHPAHPGQPAATLSAVARRVLENSRIELPAAPAADVRSGQVHDSVLTALLVLSRKYQIGVSVVRSGHPTYVFGTTRPSDHPPGRAFDTWRIDGHAVVDKTTPRSLVVEYMRAVAAAGSYNVGGPYQLSSSGSRFFTDATHHDHVHAGFLS